MISTLTMSLIDLCHGPAPKERLEAALARLKTMDLSFERKDKITDLFHYSRFQGIYVEYFLADDPILFRESLPSNQAFLQQAGSVGLDVHILQQGIPDAGIEISLKPHDPTRDVISDFSQQTIVLYVNGLARRLKQEYNNFISFIADLHELYFRKGEGPFQDATELELRRKYLTDEERKVYKRQLIESWFDSSFQLMNQRVRDEAGREAQNFLTNEKPALLGEFARLYTLYEQKGSITLEDLSSVGFDLTQRKSVLKLHHLLCKTANNLQAFGENYNEPVYGSLICFPSAEFCDFAEHHLKQYRVPVVSERVRHATTALYFCRVEHLPPEDVHFGNDAGCCIAIYPGDLNKGTDVPFYQLDLATPIIGIYQQLPEKRPRRVGIILSFATMNRAAQAVLLQNSTELSQADNPLDKKELDRLVFHTTDYFAAFARTVGFRHSAIGIGDFNTGKNYLDSSYISEPDYTKDELVKLPDLNGEEDIELPEFYSQVFTKAGFSKKGHWAYLRV